MAPSKESASGGEAAPPDLHQSVVDFFQPEATRQFSVPIRNLVIPAGASRRFGNWDGRFFLAETAAWDDNIYLSQRDKSDDISFLTTLGAAFAREGSDFAADFAAAGTWEAYLDHPEENLVDVHARGGFQYGMRRGFFRVVDIFTRSQDGLQSVTTLSGPVHVLTGQDLVVQNTNDAVATAGYTWERFAVEGQYWNQYTNYSGVFDELDGVLHTATAIGRYEHSPKVEWNLQFEYKEMDFSRRINNDWMVLGAFAGCRWIPTPKTELYGRVGYQDMDVDRTGIRKDLDEFRGPSALFRFRWEATPKVRLDAYLSEDVNPVAGANYQSTFLAGTTATWRISPVWNGRIGAKYQASDPSAGDGGQHYYDATARLGYLFKSWWEIALQYDFRALASSSAHSDYVNHRVSLQFTFLF